jgi:hypothetical protein
VGFRYYYKDPDGAITEIVDHFERYVPDMGPELASSAEEGSVGSGTVKADDPTGVFNIRGHRLFLVNEDTASGDDYGGCVYFGYTFGRQVGRRAERQGAARTFSIDLVDLNTLLGDRILHGTGNKRGEESDLARVAWLMAQAEWGIIENDDTYVDSSGGVPMDARDCNGDTPLDVLDDCAQQSGRNYHLIWLDSGGSVPLVFLVYSHEAWSTSAIRISNVLAEIDGETTFAPSFDTSLDRDPSRVYSDIYGEYDGGHVVESKQSTRDRFRNRWTHGQWERVKTAAQARKRAQRTLRDIDTELDTITTAILVPRAMVNAAMIGQAMDVHYSDLPGYEPDFVTMRIRDRTVTEVNPDLVQLALTLTGDSPAETDNTEIAGDYCVLDYAHNVSGSDDIRFEASGDAPPIGWVAQPTTGLLLPLSDSEQRPFYGIQVLGDGTVDVRFTSTAAGVTGPEFTVTWEILLNGGSVASSSLATPVPLSYWAGGNTVTVAGLAVANGDIISARVTCGPARMGFFTVPAGTSNGSEQLEVTNGSLS